MASLLIVGCSDTGESSLLTDGPKVANSVLNKVANSSDLALSVDSNSFFVSGNKVEVSGSCNISTFQRHKIQAVLVNSVTGQISNLEYVFVQGAGVATQGVCVLGRFEIIINAAYLNSGRNDIKIWLSGFDSRNIEVTNGAAASRTVSIIK
jgi:hypothetical protein